MAQDLNVTHEAKGQYPRAVDELSYALNWRVRGIYTGANIGEGSVGLGILRGVVPFNRHPDIRHLDLRQSLRDPFGELYVREFRPRTAATIYALVDVSASMSAGQPGGKLRLASEICSLLARSAHRIGDSFGLYACGTTLHYSLSFPARRGGAGAQYFSEQLARVHPVDSGVDAFLMAADELVGRKKLVFLISDFMFSAEKLKQILERLRSHDVIPVVLEAQQLKDIPRWGLVQLRDAETQRNKLMFFRPAIKKLWEDEIKRQVEEQKAVCRTFGSTPFYVGEGFDVAAFNNYLIMR